MTATLPTRDQLLAGLLAVHTEGVADFGDHGYADWSVRNDDGTCQFEIGEPGPDGDVVTLDLSMADLRALHAALTKTLLLDTSGGEPE